MMPLILSALIYFGLLTLSYYNGKQTGGKQEESQYRQPDIRMKKYQRNQTR
jgi:hypothetical protein